MPTFCRHNRFIQNCPICREPEPPKRRARTPRPYGVGRRGGGGSGAVRIRQSARQADDGYRCPLIPGLRASDDAARLAAELGFAAARLAELAAAPPGPYTEVASEPDVEEAAWLAFQIAYISPLEGPEPFAGIAAARTPWAGGAAPQLEGVPLGPRTAHDPERGSETPAAYRRWAERAGSQAAAFAGEEHWSAERRFARAFERLALPGLHRGARIDLLVSLGRLGRFEMTAGSLFLAAADSDDDTAVAAKRVFGIGDPLLIDRRAVMLAEACELPLEGLDLALYNWQRGEDGRATLGADESARGDDAGRERVAAALGL